MPRHPEISDVYLATEQQIREAMEAGASLRTACGLAGVSAPSVLRWLREGDEEPTGRYGAFSTEIRRIQARQIFEAEQAHRGHRAENPAAVQWWLQRMDPETYGEAVNSKDRPRLVEASDDEVVEALRR